VRWVCAEERDGDGDGEVAGDVHGDEWLGDQ